MSNAKDVRKKEMFDEIKDFENQTTEVENEIESEKEILNTSKDVREEFQKRVDSKKKWFYDKLASLKGSLNKNLSVFDVNTNMSRLNLLDNEDELDRYIFDIINNDVGELTSPAFEVVRSIHGESNIIDFDKLQISNRPLVLIEFQTDKSTISGILETTIILENLHGEIEGLSREINSRIPFVINDGVLEGVINSIHPSNDLNIELEFFVDRCYNSETGNNILTLAVSRVNIPHILRTRDTQYGEFDKHVTFQDTAPVSLESFERKTAKAETKITLMGNVLTTVPVNIRTTTSLYPETDDRIHQRVDLSKESFTTISRQSSIGVSGHKQFLPHEKLTISREEMVHRFPPRSTDSEIGMFNGGVPIIDRVNKRIICLEEGAVTARDLYTGIVFAKADIPEHLRGLHPVGVDYDKNHYIAVLIGQSSNDWYIILLYYSRSDSNLFDLKQTRKVSNDITYGVEDVNIWAESGYRLIRAVDEDNYGILSFKTNEIVGGNYTLTPTLFFPEGGISHVSESYDTYSGEYCRVNVVDGGHLLIVYTHIKDHVSSPDDGKSSYRQYQDILNEVYNIRGSICRIDPMRIVASGGYLLIPLVDVRNYSYDTYYENPIIEWFIGDRNDSDLGLSKLNANPRSTYISRNNPWFGSIQEKLKSLYPPSETPISVVATYVLLDGRIVTDIANLTYDFQSELFIVISGVRYVDFTPDIMGNLQYLNSEDSSFFENAFKSRGIDVSSSTFEELRSYSLVPTHGKDDVDRDHLYLQDLQDGTNKRLHINVKSVNKFQSMIDTLIDIEPTEEWNPEDFIYFGANIDGVISKLTLMFFTGDEVEVNLNQ